LTTAARATAARITNFMVKSLIEMKLCKIIIFVIGLSQTTTSQNNTMAQAQSVETLRWLRETRETFPKLDKVSS
jgi:hypothetical protein